MDSYIVVSPPNAAELDAMLREQPLIGAKTVNIKGRP